MPRLPFKITRRRLLKGALAAGGLALTTGFYTWQVEPHWLQIVERPLPVERLPNSLAGVRIAQLSDLHIGPQVDDNYLLDVFARVRQIAPEIVVYTGDFTSYFPDVLEHAQQMFAHLPTGTRGTCAILGNHDYGEYWRDYKNADALAELSRAAGVPVLRNEIAEVDGLQIVGLDEMWAHRFEPGVAFANLDRSRPAIALSHNPDTADEPGWDGFTGWILAGHTHGGQCKAPFLPPPMLPVKNRRYTSGEFSLPGGRQMYISRGVGHLLQVRINVRPEVTVFRLSAV